jgi:phospholipid N-methyltransferase
MKKQSSERLPLLSDIAVFLRCALGAPAATGAVLPSSRWLARNITAVLDEYDAPNVVELGPVPAR